MEIAFYNLMDIVNNFVKKSPEGSATQVADEMII